MTQKNPADAFTVITVHTRGMLIETRLEQARLYAFLHLPDLAMLRVGPRNYEIVMRVSENQVAFEGNHADLWEEQYQQGGLIARSYYHFPSPRQRFSSRQAIEEELRRRAAMMLPLLKERVYWQSPWGEIEVVTTFFDQYRLFLPEAYLIETATGRGFLFEEGVPDYLLSEPLQALSFSWNGFSCFSGEKAGAMITYEHPEWSTDDDLVRKEKTQQVKEALQRLAPDYLASQEETS